MPDRDRQRIKVTLIRLSQGEMKGLDIRKLKGVENLFRLRVGAYRIIFEYQPGTSPRALSISSRNDNTYNF
ncbi:MAG TPA: hypothetical protein DCZ84_02445 [Candidatus Vogelbacteria bacterium]|nr:hypothetical protein [Candidatus Vogelbacteria bacterium]HCQ92120.1 hypothetical protein [Candidatus Vogelbacteria bacterium]